MSAMASQITSLTVVYSTVYSDADQRKHESSASLAFVWGEFTGTGEFPHKGPVTQKMFPFDDVIMTTEIDFIISFTFISQVFCPMARRYGIKSDVTMK